MATDLILGTAGHIDHGKTSLIRALTGVDTDRLPDEKKRGITIDLGFAELDLGDYRLGIVDVPGHERFVRNMLAGATGTDLALLVVAADDSVKPQTREHLEILRLLGIQHGVIALTKSDLAESEWIDLVEEEVRALVGDTFLSSAPLVRTSTTTGQGLDQLQEALAEAAHQSVGAERSNMTEGPFRMAVDRTFTVSGHGTVVTGSVSSGTAHIGDELVIEPDAIPVRVRGLQNHDRTVERVHRGQRAAINLAGVHHRDIVRGHELASPGYLTPSKLLTVRMKLLGPAPRPLKHRSRVRLHVGTAEVLASVMLLDQQSLGPGNESNAQLFLSEPCVTSWAQPFVIRSESPVETIGGGQILDPSAHILRKPDLEVQQRIDELTSNSPTTRAAAAYYFTGIHDLHPKHLALKAGIHDVQPVFDELVQRGEIMEIELTPTRSIWVHRLVVEQLRQRIEATLKKLHEENPLRSKIERSKLLNRFKYLDNEPLVATILDNMSRDGFVAMTKIGVSLTGCGPKLSSNERKLLQYLIEKFKQAGFEPPSVKECQQSTTKLQHAVPDLIALAVADGELVEVAREFYLHSDADKKLRETLRHELSDGRGLTISQMREILNTSRKYTVPLAEYLDRTGFTRREGDLRVLDTVK